MNYLIILLMGLFAMWAAPVAEAAPSSMAVYPSREALVVRPGESQTFSVTVANPGQATLRVRAYLSDWGLKPDGQLLFLPVGKSAHSAADMVTFTPSQFVLEPDRSQSVRVTISVPPDTAGGEYHCMVFFESVAPPASAREPGTTFRFNQRIGNTIYVAVPPFNRLATIAALAYLPPTKRQPSRVGIALRNMGRVHVRAAGKLRLERQDGQLVLQKSLSDLPVLRESQRLFFIPMEEQLPTGRIKATLTLDYGGEELIEAVTHFEL